MSTAPDDEPSPRDVSPGEAAGNAWIDGSDDNLAESLKGREARRAADVAFLHALLDQALRPDAAAREIRVQRVAAAVRETVMPAKPVTAPSRRRWMATLATIAAVFLIGIAIRSSFNPTTTATAAVAVDNALKVAAAEVDRAYHVTSDVVLPDGSPLAITADLWVRGGEHYVLRQDGLRGDIMLGSDSEEHWVVPPFGPVVTGSEPGLLEQRLLRDQVTMPFLQVTTLLERLADRYDLKLEASEEIATAEDTPAVWCTHVVGTKRDANDGFTPDVISLWTARQSGVVQQIEMTWQKAEGQAGIRRLVMKLQPIKSELPPDWYHHSAHHDGNRRVLHRGGSGNTDDDQ